jgi:DNA repair protein RadC
MKQEVSMERNDELKRCGGLRFGPRVRVELVRDSQPLYEATLTKAEDVFRFFHDEVARWDRERFVSVILDGRNRVLGIDEVSVGSLGSSIVHPRELFKSAILANGAAIICVHNHPSGDPTPSAEDRRITEKIKRAGEILGIPCLDHVVIGHERFASFADQGLF